MQNNLSDHHIQRTEISKEMRCTHVMGFLQ